MRVYVFILFWLNNLILIYVITLGEIFHYVEILKILKIAKNDQKFPYFDHKKNSSNDNDFCTLPINKIII